MNTRKKIYTAALITLIFSLSGCGPYQDLSPPLNGDSLEIIIDTPSGFAPMDVDAVYRSQTCKKTGHSLSNGSKFIRDEYQELTITPKIQEGHKTHTATIPVDGGGYCQWMLSNIRFGVIHKDIEQFGSNTHIGIPATVIIRFDEHRTFGGSNEKYVEGDLMIDKEFFPWIHEQFVGGYEKSINLVGKDGLDISYHAPSTRKINFTPKIHSNFLVSSKGNKEKVIGLYSEFTYPDGSKQRERLGFPNFEKLQSIQKKSQTKK